MGIGRIASNALTTVVNVVRKHPKTTVACAAGALGIGGLIAYSAATTTRKQQTEAMNRMYLMNPFLNPIGWFTHVINPLSTETTPLDGMAKYFVDTNNKRYQEWYNNLTPQEKVQEFYRNGGKGVNFDAQG